MQFWDWLLGYQWPDTISRPEFADPAIRELSRLNGSRRGMAQHAGVQLTADHVAQVLVGGSLAGVSTCGICRTVAAPLHPSIANSRRLGLGPAAFIAFVALRQVANIPLSPDAMAIMGIAAQFAPLCASPFRLVRLTTAGVMELNERGWNMERSSDRWRWELGFLMTLQPPGRGFSCPTRRRRAS